jgi:uncharacterized protein (DUF1501 family)
LLAALKRIFRAPPPLLNPNRSPFPLSPAAPILPGLTQQQFTATTSDGSHPAWTWSVNGIAGGNATLGIISAGAALGVNRQIFFCSYGGFDTHSNQLPQQVQLLTIISQSMSAFYQATQELGVANNVTSFTLSEFGRTLEPGSNGGTDHAWGSHQFILGGAVKGNAIYGTFPTLALGGPDDADQNGRWIPTTALDQYAATLATWFGVSAANLPSIFPNLANFPTANLGFMG